MRAEDILQRDIVRYLRLVLPESAYRVFAIPNGGQRSASGGAMMVATGLLAGVPDLQIVGPGGQSWFVEVKTPKGALSPPQEEFCSWLHARGAPYVVARSIADVQAALQHWRLKTREAA